MDFGLRQSPAPTFFYALLDLRGSCLHSLSAALQSPPAARHLGVPQVHRTPPEDLILLAGVVPVHVRLPEAQSVREEVR